MAPAAAAAAAPAQQQQEQQQQQQSPHTAAGRPFAALRCISKPTLAVLAALGFARATPVQEAVIPLFCGHKDVAVDACTGSGKTLAFVVPLVERLRRLEERLKPHQVGAIVVSPTRELAKQIHAVAAPFVDSVPGLSSLLLVGGTDPSADVAAFKAGGGNVLVGTPGRLDDVLKRLGAAADVKPLEVLVLDEADRLLDMGFQRQLDAIMARLPRQRRTGLFSATQTEAVEALARAGLRNPVKVAVAVSAAPAADGGGEQPRKKQKLAAAAAAAGGGGGEAAAGAGGGALEQVTPSSLTLQYMIVPVEQKLPQLVSLLAAHGGRCKAIVYFLTCASVEWHALVLRRLPALKGLRVAALHGKLKQAAREATLARFSELPAGVLLATDVAARGLDIPDVALILQFDMPQDPAAFVHRVGRTARMGRSGAALALLAPSEATYAEFLRLRRVHMTRREPAADAPEPGALAAWLRSEAEGDREVMEKASRAYVSLVRGYKEHHCKFVFRLQELPLGPLAQAMGLLRLPRMPELKKGSAANALTAFTPSAVEPDSVRFRDKARERQRQQALKQKAAAAGDGGDARPQQQQPKQQQQHAAGAAEPGARLTAAKRRQLQARDELAELQHDYAMLRKLKKGKISEHAFDVATGLSSEDEDDQAAAAAAAARSDGSSDDGDGEDGGGQPSLPPQPQKQPMQQPPKQPGRTVLQQEAALRKRKARRLKKRQKKQQQGAAA